MTDFVRSASRWLGVTAFAFGVLLPLRALGQDHLDTSFGNNGRVLTPFNFNGASSNDRALAVAIRPSNGKIVVAGYCQAVPAIEERFCLAQYDTDGSLDPTFGTGGQVMTAMLGGLQQIVAVAYQSDGKIVAAGNCNQDLCLARYNTDGTLDTTFDGDGKVFTDINSGNNDQAAALAMLAGDKILVAGTSGTPSGAGYILLARYNANGSLDNGFGTGGLALTPLGETGVVPFAMAVNGSAIYLGGGGGPLLSLAIGKFNSSTGALDTSWATNGYTYGNNADPQLYSSVAWGLAIQNGKLVTAGTCAVPFVGTNFCLARFTADGAIDTSFGNTASTTDNWAIYSVLQDNDEARAMVLRPDATILAAGTCVDGAFFGSFCLADFGLNATSMSFSVVTAVGVRGDYVTGLALQPDGKPIVTGFCQVAVNDDDFCAARYGDALLTPTVTTVIHNASHAPVTSVLTASAVHDAVTVSGSAATPTGTVLIDWFTNGTCGGSPAATSSSQALAAGFVDAEGFTQMPPTAGSYAFRARYNGDAAYTTATGPCAALTVVDPPPPTKTTPTVTTRILLESTHAAPEGGAVLVGSTIHSVVSVSGSGPIPTGQVTLSWFTNNTCRGRAAAVSGPGTLDIDGDLEFTSFSQTPTKKGPYAFQARYLGDDHYNAATGPCEPVNVVAKLTPRIATTVRDSAGQLVTVVDVNDTVHAMAIFDRINGEVPTGMTTVQFFSNGTCKGKATASGTATLVLDSVSGKAVADAVTFHRTLANAGAYAFNVIYPGDAKFAAQTGACAAVQAVP